jgi:hypothetical protein
MRLLSDLQIFKCHIIRNDLKVLAVHSSSVLMLNIEVLLTDKTLELDVLCITEHWLNENEIDYYNFCKLLPCLEILQEK